MDQRVLQFRHVPQLDHVVANCYHSRKAVHLTGGLLFEKRRDNMEKAKFGLQWHITDKCDQRCKHCYIYEGTDKECSSELNLSTLNEILENFIQCCNKLDAEPVIAITGGDPLLYSKIWEFLELFKEKKIKFSILGNPFHLSYEVVKKLEELGCTNYQMSLDGLKETHDSIRKKGSFDSTLKSLEFFENTRISTAIMTTVSKTNINEIPNLVDIVVKHKVKHFGFTRYCPSSKDINLMVSSYEYKQFLDKMWKKYMENQQSETIFVLKDHLWMLYLYEKGLFNPKQFDNPEDLILDGCHCGINHITILSNGDVYACRRSDTLVGCALNESLYDIFTGSKMDQYRCYNCFEYCKKCELKNFCRGCPSVAKCATGNFYAKDPQCWKMF